MSSIISQSTTSSENDNESVMSLNENEVNGEDLNEISTIQSRERRTMAIWMRNFYYEGYHPLDQQFLRELTGPAFNIVDQPFVYLGNNHCRALIHITFNEEPLVLVCNRVINTPDYCRCAHQICNRPEAVIGNIGLYRQFPYTDLDVRHGIATWVHPVELLRHMLRNFENNRPLYEEFYWIYLRVVAIP